MITCATRIILGSKTKNGHTYGQECIDKIIKIMSEQNTIVHLEEQPLGTTDFSRAFGTATRGFLDNGRLMVEVEPRDHVLAKSIINCAESCKKIIMLSADLKARVCDNKELCEQKGWVPGFIYDVDSVTAFALMYPEEWINK